MIEKYPTFKFVRGDTQGFVVKATFIDGTPIQQIDIKDILITCRQFPYKSSNIIFQKGINDVYVPAKYNERGELIEPEHLPYYTSVIFLADNFDESKLNELYVEEEIEKEE